MTYDDLLEVASSESAMVEGHLFNVRLCNALADLMKKHPGKRVQDRIPVHRLREIFARARDGKAKAAAI